MRNCSPDKRILVTGEGGFPGSHLCERLVGGSVSTLSENQSTCIPLGRIRRLAHPGKLPLEIIEVQSGSCLGEDDIVGFEEDHGRQ